MKKLIAVSILLTILSAAVFAQFTVQLNADFYPDMLRARAPLDDSADKEKGTYEGTGTFDVFTQGTWKTNELRLSLRYNDPNKNYSGYVRFRGDSLFDGGQSYPGLNAPGGAVNDAGSVNFQTLLNLYIDEFEIMGKAGILNAKVSNVADRGKVDRFQNFHNFMDGVKVDNYGVLIPSLGGHTVGVIAFQLGVADYDANNLRRSAPNINNTYVAFGATFSPISVQVAGDMKPIANSGNPKAYSKIGGAVRVSGAKVADIVNFDVIYKIRGIDPDTDNKQLHQPDGKGMWDNVFGLYANLLMVENLGLGLGYTGSVKFQEERSEDGGGEMKYTHPYYSGIDLRGTFTGIKKLTITTNHNISFTGTKGDDDAKTEITGINGADLGDKITENYIGLYNSLGANYQLSDALLASVQVANRFASYEYANDGDKRTLLYDKLRIVGLAEYKIAKVTLAGGLAFQIDHQTEKPVTGDQVKEGLFTFGIPLRFRVEF